MTEQDTHRGLFHGKLRRVATIALCGIALVWVGLGIDFVVDWPFTQAHVKRDLEHFASSDVKFGQFQQIFFPHPGYQARGMVFSRRADGREVQIASVERVKCEAGWLSMLMFQHRLRNLTVQGVHVSIPHPMPKAMRFFPGMKEKTTVSILTADGAVLDIAPRSEGSSPLRFQFPKLQLGEVKAEKSISIDMVAQIPKLPATVSVRGRFGPMPKGRMGQTELWGVYQLQHGDLGATGSLGGLVNSDGSFRGALAHCQVGGNIKVQHFQISSVHHPVDVFGKFETTVDGLTGDVDLRSSTVHYLGTELTASGTVRSAGGQKGKTESIEVKSKGARIEDLLTLFTQAEPPALRGPVDLHANVVVPPSDAEFLKRMQLKGAFRISQAEFQHAGTQRNVNKLSDRARGKKSDEAVVANQHMLSTFAAQVVTRDGVAWLSDADFQTPGAKATGEGSYNMLTKAIDLKGKLAIQASLSKAAGGMKSVLLLPLDPFFKKGNAGAVVPIQVTGTYSNPKFRVSLKP